MIYLLTLIAGADYDQYDAKVVRAPTERDARLEANKSTGAEGKVWTDPNFVHCKEVDPSGMTEELLGSFNAG